MALSASMVVENWMQAIPLGWSFLSVWMSTYNTWPVEEESRKKKEYHRVPNQPPKWNKQCNEGSADCITSFNSCGQKVPNMSTTPPATHQLPWRHLAAAAIRQKSLTIRGKNNRQWIQRICQSKALSLKKKTPRGRACLNSKQREHEVIPI